MDASSAERDIILTKYLFEMQWCINEWVFKNLETWLKIHNAILQEQAVHLFVTLQDDQVSPEQEQNNLFLTLLAQTEVQ